MPSETGWQPDGSYVPCDQCGYTPEPDRSPSFATPVRIPGTLHHNDCPTILRLSFQDAQELQEKLDEMDRVRRRAAGEARNFVIG